MRRTAAVSVREEHVVDLCHHTFRLQLANDLKRIDAGTTLQTDTKYLFGDRTPHRHLVGRLEGLEG
jgi:hypothetical protein